VRESGRPPSGNGASSFHLWWDLPEIPLRSVAATLEILQTPEVDDLYFFAIQASFMRVQEHFGGAHLGLQWNRRHLGQRAVNWGGYDEAGAILSGTPSELTSTPDDPNTRDYAWRSNTGYRLSIGPGTPDANGQVGWPGVVEDLATGERVVVRRLLTGGDALRSPVMWMEVFAECSAPSVAVRWSDLEAVATDGSTLRPKSCRVAYQAYSSGGCTNTSSTVQGAHFEQRTNVARTTEADAVLTLD
jgi:hypothetical protein